MIKKPEDGFFFPRHVIFHHAKPEGGSHGDSAPEQKPAGDVQALQKLIPEHGRAELVLDRATATIGPKESHEMNENEFSRVESFRNDPDKMAPDAQLNDFFSKPPQTDDTGQLWRLLCVPRRMQYGLIMDLPKGELHNNQVKFLRMHEAEIRQNHQFAHESYAAISPIGKVPVLAVPLKHRSVLEPTEKPVLMLGSTLAAEMAGDKDLQEKAEYVRDSADPVKALAALRALPPEKVRDATVTMNFGSEMFLGNVKLEDLTKATDELLKFAKDNNIKVVMGTPLHIYISAVSDRARFWELNTPEQTKKADELRKEYTDYLAVQYQQGNIRAIVGIGLGMTPSHYANQTDSSEGTALDYYSDSNDLGKGLNSDGTYLCASAMIEGIKTANGDSSTAITSADYEYALGGAGTAYKDRHVVEDPVEARKILEAQGKTLELLPDLDKRLSIATLPYSVRNALWALHAIEVYEEIGASVDSRDLAYQCEKAEHEINHLPSGPARDYATYWFYAYKSSMYYGRAWWTAVKGDNVGSRRLIDEAVDQNRKYLEMVDATYSDFNLSREGLDKIRPNARLFAKRLKTLQDDMRNNVSYVGFNRTPPDPEKFDLKAESSDIFDSDKQAPRP